jgi:hypothetical protein
VFWCLGGKKILEILLVLLVGARRKSCYWGPAKFLVVPVDRCQLSVVFSGIFPIDFKYAFSLGASSSTIGLSLFTSFSFKIFLLVALLSQCWVSFKEPLAILTK